MQEFNPKSIMLEGDKNTEELLRGFDDAISDLPKFKKVFSVQTHNYQNEKGLQSVLKALQSQISTNENEKFDNIMSPANLVDIEKYSSKEAPIIGPKIEELPNT